MKNTNSKTWYITADNIETATQQITYAVVKNRMKSGTPQWLQIRLEMPKAVRRIFNRSALPELVDDIKAEKQAHQKAISTGAGYAVLGQLQTAVHSMNDEIHDIEKAEISTSADDMLQSCYLALFENINKDIVNDRIEWIDRNGHKHNGTILQYACYEAGQAVTVGNSSDIDIYTQDKDENEKPIDSLFIAEDFATAIINSLSEPCINDLVNAVKSDRRKEVVTLLNNGYNRVQIADILKVTKQTVNGHIDGIIKDLRTAYPEYIKEFENRKRLSGYSSHYHKLPDNAVKIF